MIRDGKTSISPRQARTPEELANLAHLRRTGRFIAARI
jgi:hypothetical protein